MAASGVNIKMGVSGISQFKQNLNQAKSAVKTLDAQLALTEKQFKASGDAESYMAEKGELLKAKLEKQNQIVNSCQKALDEMTKNGVDRASKSYQDMYQQMINAKGAMIDTEQAMNNIAGAAEDADVAVSGMDEGLNQIGKNVSIENVKSALTTMTSGMENVMKKAVQIGNYITQHVLGAGDWADDLNTRASIYEMDPEELQRMEKTSALIDTSVDAIINAKKRMKKAIGAGSADTVDALEALGLGNVVDTDPEEMFWKIGDAIMNLGDAYTREEYAQKLFGRSWSELIPLFDAGREKYEEMNASWNVVPKESLDALQEADDAVETLNNELETAERQLEAALAPAVTEVTKAITGLVEQFNIYLQSEDGKKMMDSLSTAVTSLFDDLTKIDPEQTMQDVISVFDNLKAGLEWIKDNKDGVVTAIEAFIGVWAGLKVASGVTTALELINGIKGLTAASAASAGTTAGTSWASAFASAAMKAAPFLAFLYTLLNPASTAGNDVDTLFDENGNLTTAGQEALGANGEDLMIGPQKQYGKFNETQYNMLQDYWDKYRTGTAGAEDWDVLKAEFGKSDAYWDKFLEIAKEMYGLDKGMNDLPDYLFAEPNQGGTPSWLSGPLQNLSGLPQQVRQAVVTGIGTMCVYLDGQKVGELTAPYVSGELAGAVLND